MNNSLVSQATEPDRSVEQMSVHRFDVAGTAMSVHKMRDSVRQHPGSEKLWLLINKAMSLKILRG